MFCAFSAEASLKLSAQANMYDGAEKTRPAVGLSYYQPMFKTVALNSFVGYGDEPFEVKDDALWFVSKAQLDFYFGKWTVSPGITYKHIEPYDQSRSYGFVKADYKLF